MQDVHDFASYMIYSDIFAFHSMHDRYATRSSLPQYWQQRVTVTMMSLLFGTVMCSFYHIVIQV